VAAFAAAPVSNPDGNPGVRLHILVDETTIPIEPFPNEFTDFFRLKDLYFGTSTERGNADWRKILDAKGKVYRYCIFADRLSDESSGLAELPGNDFIVTFGAWHRVITRADRTGTFMHELGHTLGLYHGGQQDDLANASRYNYKPNYHSVMNYTWQIPDHSGWILDYSPTVLPPLIEAALLESAGIGGDPVAVPLIGPPPAQPHSESGPIDFNRNGTIDPTPVSADINYIYPQDIGSPGDVLLGHNDWAALRYNFRTTDGYAPGASPRTTSHAEITPEIADYLAKLFGPPACPGDFNDDAVVNSQDFFDFLVAFFAADPGADFNADLLINSQDFFDYLAAFFIGC
jgi:hypothetical protein